MGSPSAFDHATEQGVADDDLEDAAGGPHRLALLDVADLAEDDGADRLLVEVQRQAERAALELEQLVDRRVREARHAGDAVADLDDPADLGRLGLGENPSRFLRRAAVMSSGLNVSSAMCSFIRSLRGAVRDGSGPSRR